MNARVATVLLVCCSVIAGSFYATAASPSSSISPARAAAWEYRTVVLSSDGALTSEVRELGRHGWEMFDVAAIEVDGATDHLVGYFKRSR